MQAEAGVSWLLKFIRVQVSWIEKKVAFEVYLLGIPLLKLLQWFKGRKKSGKKKRKPKKKAGNADAQDASVPLIEEREQAVSEAAGEESEVEPGEKLGDASEEDSTEAAGEQTEADGDTEDSADVVKDQATGEMSAESPAGASVENPDEKPVEALAETETETPIEETQEAPKKSLGEKIRGIFGKIAHVIEILFGLPEKISNTFEKIEDKIEAVSDKAESLVDKAKWGLDLLQSKMFKDVFSVAKKEILAIIKHILPYKLKGSVEYGTGDPASTGEILAMLASIYPILPKDLSISPDFEESLLNCNLVLKGRIRLIVLVFHGVKILLNKQVRRLIKKVRRKEA